MPRIVEHLQKKDSYSFFENIKFYYEKKETNRPTNTINKVGAIPEVKLLTFKCLKSKSKLRKYGEQFRPIVLRNKKISSEYFL